jgi:intracellular sulfur oxidation DsrE/DsrF family protein
MTVRDNDTTPANERRDFLTQMGAGALAMLGTPALLHAAPSAPSAATPPMNEKWVDNLKGKHRQYFDATNVDSGFSLAYAMNWMDTMKTAYGLTDKDVNAVIGLRHFSIPIAYTDEIWAKYNLGAFAKVNDPKTNAPAKRNIYLNSQQGDLMFPSMAIDKLQPRGVTFVVCNIAHSVLSGAMAQAAGVTAAVAKAEWEKGLIPGFILVDSGVLAVHRAQEKGKCTYCYAG